MFAKGLCLLFLLILSGCTAFITTPANHEVSLELAMAQGHLIHFEAEEVQSIRETFTVERRSITNEQMMTLTPTFLTQRDLRFAIPNRHLAAVYVERGDRVRAGDVLAELIPLNAEESERLFIRRENMRIELERFDRDFQNAYDQWQIDLMLAAEAVDFAEDDDWVRAALELSRQEVRFRQFLFGQEANRERLERQLREINDVIAGDQIIAPMDGVVIFALSATAGTFMSWYPIIVTLASEDSLFFMDSFLEGAYVTWSGHGIRYTYGEILLVTVRIPAAEAQLTFEAKVVNDPRATYAITQMRYLLAPLDRLELMDFLAEHGIDLAMIAPPRFEVIKSTTIHNALVVPAAAIGTTTIVYNPEGTARSVTYQHVYLYEDGQRRQQNIVTGASCLLEFREGLTYIEILDGLYEGQEVVIR
jgi:hypothetical protein